MKFLIGLLISLAAGALTGCGFTEYKNPNSSSPGTVTSSTTNPGTSPVSGTTPTGGGGGTSSATFSAVSSQILQPKCVTCHSSFGTYSGVMSAVTAGNPSGSALYTMVESGQMPQGGPALSSDEVTLINTWIQNGAQND